MFKFKNYPPSFIPLRHWHFRMGSNGKGSYLVIPTVWNWITRKSSAEFINHFNK